MNKHQRSYADTYQDVLTPREPGALAELPLLEQFRFFRFLSSALTAQIGQNALLYTLLIVVIQETGSGIHASLFVLCSLFPVIVLGLLAGIAVDYLPNKAILVTANLVRAVGVALLLYEPTSVWAIYLFVLVLWTVQQFSSPAASSALPSLLPRDRFSAGLGLLNVTNLIAQLIGLVIFAPVMLKLFGPEPVYATAAVLYAAAAYFVFSIPNMTDKLAKREELIHERSQMAFVDAMSAGWKMLRSDPIAFQAMIQYTLLEMALAILVVLMPQYAKDVVETSAENLVFIFSPAAAGLFLGIWMTPVIAKMMGNPRTARIGFVLFVASIACFAFSGVIGELIERNGFVPLEEIASFFDIRIAVVVTMIVAVPAGLGAGIVGIAGKAVLLERAPAEGRGRIFATQSWGSGVLSVIPIFAAGLISAVVDIRITIFLLALTLALVALYARFGLKPQGQVAVPA